MIELVFQDHVSILVAEREMVMQQKKSINRTIKSLQSAGIKLDKEQLQELMIAERENLACGIFTAMSTHLIAGSSFPNMESSQFPDYCQRLAKGAYQLADAFIKVSNSELDRITSSTNS
jgi:hypothetical protein